MLFRGGAGVNVQTGLSSDDIAGGRRLYPTAPTNFGTIQGTVTKSGSPVLGAAVFALTSVSNVAAGTVTLPNGTYEINSLAAGTYQIRVAPLAGAENPRRRAEKMSLFLTGLMPTEEFRFHGDIRRPRRDALRPVPRWCARHRGRSARRRTRPT